MKQKGDRFERKVAKIFTDWYGSLVRRTPLSGAASRMKTDILGDSKFPFVVECKNTEAWRIETILTGKGYIFEEYIKDLDKQEESIYYSEGKIKLLVLGRNYAKPIVFIEDVELKKITDKVGDVYVGVDKLVVYFKNR
ncbi:MAG: hypothetical protein ABDI07_11635, partial [Candidatus Kryptonium sp.]